MSVVWTIVNKANLAISGPAWCSVKYCADRSLGVELYGDRHTRPRRGGSGSVPVYKDWLLFGNF